MIQFKNLKSDPKFGILLFLLALLLISLSHYIPGSSEFMNHPVTRFFYDLFCVGLPLFLTIHGLLARATYREGALGDRQRERVRELEWRLFIWSLLAVSTDYVILFGFQIKSITILLWPILISWLIYEPLLNAKKPDRKSLWKLPERTRLAGLKPRKVENPVGLLCWGVIWATWILVTIVASSDIRDSVHSNLSKRKDVEEALLLLSVSGGALVLSPLLIHWWIRRPEPMVEHNLKKLTLAYDELRRFKAWSAYFIATSYIAPILLLVFMGSVGGDEGFAVVLILFAPALTLMAFSVSFNRRRKEISELLNEPEEGSLTEPQISSRT